METFQAITGRHGVLRYEPTPVEPAKIEQVLQAAIAAPSAANTQPWLLVVVTEPELVRLSGELRPFGRGRSILSHGDIDAEEQHQRYQ